MSYVIYYMHTVYMLYNLYYRDYFVQLDGIVFLVDAADSQRFEESRKELTGLLSSNDLKDVPIVILGNKIDKKEV